MNEKLALETLKQAYLVLLSMPHSGLRARNQGVFCALRDAIASETGRTAQDVQDTMESLALELRLVA